MSRFRLLASVTVSAIAKDFDHTVLPNETQIIVSMQRYPQVMGYLLDNYTAAYGPNGCSKVFFMLHPGTNLDSKKAVIADYLDKNYYGKWEAKNLNFTPLKDVMFSPQNSGTGMQKGDKSRLHILLAAVLAILFFAISNYINLTVANTGFRAKEISR